jgi:hypothetical protein
MKIKTNELTRAALGWAVAKCEGAEYKEGFLFWHDHEGAKRQIKPYPYSTDWSQGGPIIEREKLQITNDGADWGAGYRGGKHFNDPESHYQTGPTPLIAAMRCYVASKLGDEVDVPEALCPPTA